MTDPRIDAVSDMAEAEAANAKDPHVKHVLNSFASFLGCLAEDIGDLEYVRSETLQGLVNSVKLDTANDRRDLQCLFDVASRHDPKMKEHVSLFLTTEEWDGLQRFRE